MDAMMEAVLAEHRLDAKTICGAKSIPVVHHHGSESDRNPGPLRVLTCSEPAGHDGPHRDAVCCWNFQSFDDWQVDTRQPRTFDWCSCGKEWPCPTVRAVQATYAAARSGENAPA